MIVERIEIEVNVFSHSNSVLTGNVVGVINLDFHFMFVPSNSQHSARTPKLALYQKTFNMQESIHGRTDLPLSNIARPGSSLSILTWQQRFVITVTSLRCGMNRGRSQKRLDPLKECSENLNWIDQVTSVI